jgi:chitinase
MPQVEDFRVAGYLPEYRFYIDLPTASSHLTDLILFSAKPTASGMLTNFVNPEQIETAMARKAANPDLAILMSIGGGGRSENFHAIASDAGKRQKFVGAVNKMIDRYGFDGVDLDWESPSNEHEMSSYVRLLNEIHVSFASTPRVLTVALHPGQTLGDHGYHAVDRVHFMAYDMQASSGNHADFIAVRQAVDWIIASGCPRNKLVLGLPLYARNKANSGDVKTYAELMDDMLVVASDEDAAAGVPFAERLDPVYGTANAYGSFPYDSRHKAQRKTQWAKNYGLMGVFFWEIGQDKIEKEVSVLEAVAAVRSGEVKIPNPEGEYMVPDGGLQQPASSSRERRKAEGKRAKYKQPILPEEPVQKKKRRSRRGDDEL